jgi:hypothetical protein
MADINKKVEVLTDIPASEIDTIERDYRASGAELTVTRQANGMFTLEAVFTRDSRYQASGKAVLR